MTARVAAPATSALWERFEVTATAAGARVMHVSRDGLPATLREFGDDAGIAVDSTLRALCPELAGVGDEAVASYGVAVTLARLCVAETGSVVLAEGQLRDRLLRELCRHHVAIVRESDIVGSLPDLAGPLRDLLARGPGYFTFVTGPSRTADIEKILTVGVHGAAELTVVVVPGLAPQIDGSVS